MKSKPNDSLSRRERQIMDILYRRGRASASDVHQSLPDRPSYSAVRAKLRILEEKGHVRHEEAGLRYIFLPTLPREKAKLSAMKHLLDTFFGGSAEQAVVALLDMRATRLSPEELEKLSSLIEKTKSEARKP